MRVCLTPAASQLNQTKRIGAKQKAAKRTCRPSPFTCECVDTRCVLVVLATSSIRILPSTA